MLSKVFFCCDFSDSGADNKNNNNSDGNKSKASNDDFYSGGFGSLNPYAVTVDDGGTGQR